LEEWELKAVGIVCIIKTDDLWELLLHGAEGIYSAAVPALGLGISLKVEDGDMRCSPPALLEVLRQVLERSAGRVSVPMEGLAHHVEPVQRNTRGAVTGSLRATGRLRFT
jgi:L-asparaginase II